MGCALRDSVESLHSGVASTVIDCTGGGVRMVREGGIPFKDIAASIIRIAWVMFLSKCDNMCGCTIGFAGIYQWKA